MADSASTSAAATGGEAADTKQQQLSFLELFYELARVEPSRRVHAAEELVRQLLEKQKTSTEIENSKSGFTGCFKELAYTLKRLIRGLLSPRAAARQGFALALHQVLVCQPLRETIEPAHLFQKVAETMNLPPSAKRQDIRESYFSKITFFMVLHRARILYAEGVVDKKLPGVVKQLTEMAQRKPYLREICFELLAQIAARVPRSSLDDVVLHQVRPFFAEGESVTAEALSFSLALRRILASGVEAEAGDELSRAAQLCLRPRVLESVEALKHSSASFPRLHSVWGRIFRLPGVETAGEIMHNPQRKDDQAYFTSLSETQLRQDVAVWTQVVDRSIFTSTHERQFIGFELFKALVASPAYSSRPATDRVFLLTPNFVRCVHNSARSTKNYLFKPANLVISVIEDQPPAVRLAAVTVMFSCLSGQPDKGIVQRLLKGLTTAEADAFVQSLQQRFLTVETVDDADDASGADGGVANGDDRGGKSGNNGNDDDDDNDGDSAAKRKRDKNPRPFLADALCAAARPTSRLPCSPASVLSVFDFLFVHSFIDLSVPGEDARDLEIPPPAVDAVDATKKKKTKKKTKKQQRGHQASAGGEENFLRTPRPMLTAADRASCQKNFFDLVHSLSNQTAAGNSSDDSSSATTTTEQSSTTDINASLDRLHSLHERIESLISHDDGEFVYEWTEDDASTRSKALTLARSLQSQRHAETSKKSGGKVAPDSLMRRGLESLLLQICFTHFEQPGEAGEHLQELILCESQLKDPATRDKAMVVLTDLLLAVLASPSQRLRHAVNLAWRDLCWLATSENARALAGVLTSSADELFGGHGDDDDDSDVEMEMLGDASDEDSNDGSDDDEMSLDIDEDAVDASTAQGEDVTILQANENASNSEGDSSSSDSDSDGDGDDNEQDEDEDSPATGAHHGHSHAHGSSDHDHADAARGTEVDDVEDARIEEEALAAIVRLRKEKSNHAQMVKQQTVHFKHRVLDLLECILQQRGVDQSTGKVVSSLVAAFVRSAVGPSLLKAESKKQRGKKSTQGSRPKPSKRKQSNFSEAASLHKRIHGLVLKTLPAAKRKSHVVVEGDSIAAAPSTKAKKKASKKKQTRDEQGSASEAARVQLAADELVELAVLLFTAHGPSIQAVASTDMARACVAAVISLLKFAFPMQEAAAAAAAGTDDTVPMSHDTVVASGLARHPELLGVAQAFLAAAANEVFCRKNPRIAASLFSELVQKYPACSWQLFAPRLSVLLLATPATGGGGESDAFAADLANTHKPRKNASKKERAQAAAEKAEAEEKAQEKARAAVRDGTFTRLVGPKSSFQRCEAFGVLTSLLRNRATATTEVPREACAQLLPQLSESFSAAIELGTGDRKHPINKAKRLKEVVKFGRNILSAADRLAELGISIAGGKDKGGNDEEDEDDEDDDDDVVSAMAKSVKRFIASGNSPSPAIERSLLELAKWGKGTTKAKSKRKAETSVVETPKKQLKTQAGADADAGAGPSKSSQSGSKKKKNKKKSTKKKAGSTKRVRN